MAQADGFSQDFVEAQRLGDRASDLRHLQDVRQPRSKMIALRREEHLRLVFEAAKRFAMDDAIAIALIGGPQIVLRLVAIASASFGAFRGAGHERVVLDFLERLADVHRLNSERSEESAVEPRTFSSLRLG